MDTATQADTSQADASIPLDAKLRVSFWIWRPRYARIWWSGAVLYWAGSALSFFAPQLETFYSTTLAGYLNIVFYPPVILFILGLGYVRAKLDNGEWILTAPDPAARQPERSVGGFLDPMADPLDPRSPRYWD